MDDPQRSAEHCMVCREPLEYRSEALECSCHFCGRPGETLIACPAGHYVCDACHGAAARDLLPRLAAQTKSTAPEDILEELFALPKLPMHGPEHHPMAALALLTAAARQGVELPEKALEEAVRRGFQVPGGACGYLGGCGAGISLGIAVSLLTGATPVRGPQRALANRAAARGLDALADKKARCCKRALRRCVTEGRLFLKEELGIVLPSPRRRPVCRDVHRNRECPGPACPFFPDESAQRRKTSAS